MGLVRMGSKKKDTKSKRYTPTNRRQLPLRSRPLRRIDPTSRLNQTAENRLQEEKRGVLV